MTDDSLAEIIAGLETLALGCGFTNTTKIDVATINVRQEVRDACTEDKCQTYGKSWSCPPACGSLAECEKELRQFKAGLILQSTGKLDDPFDYETISRTGEEHSARLLSFHKKLETFFTPAEAGQSSLAVNRNTGRSWLLLGSGCCKLCKQCTYPQSPCLYPEKMIISMEAMGILVSEFCRANNIPYYYGPNTLTFVGCLLIK